ncbi:hypothetical protein [Actinoplanes sp. URMC 104]|uniref:hypothetical protein n=1 Tax=Actinoplanes sp. URMC 104 TaxID=3423409 RepID=UPI003F1B84CA
MDALDPELHIAVLACDPAEPRIEAPTAEQPCRDITGPQDCGDLADDAQLRFGLLLHACDPARHEL